MLERDARERVLWLEALFALLLSLGAGRASAQTDSREEHPPDLSVLGAVDPDMVTAIKNAVRDASRKLATSECREIFSDFQDRAGRTLTRNLETKVETGSSYLRWLIFRNAENDDSCLRSKRILGTNPGDRFIHFCAQFKRIQLTDPGYSAALIIHEELHSLGLPENPPSSAAITNRVIARCGR